MKLTFSIALFFFCCTFSKATTDLFTGFKAYKKTYNNDIYLEGNNYTIYIKDSKTSLNPGWLRAKQEQRLEKQYDDFSTDFIVKYSSKKKSDDFRIYYSQEDPNEYITTYLYENKNKRLSGIRFSTQMQPDTLFENQMTVFIKEYGVPDSLFFTPKSSFDFYGKNITLPSDYRMRDFTDISGKNYYEYISWEEFADTQKAEAQKESYKRELFYPRSKIARDNNILDTCQIEVSFLGKSVMADKISRYHLFGRKSYMHITNYLMLGEADDKTVLLRVAINEDSLANREKLPDFITENFFHELSPRRLFEFKQFEIPAEDTIAIAQQKRGPFYHYYNNNTKINGFTFGLGNIDEIKNVTENGIRIEVPGTSVIAVFGLPYLLFPPEHLNKDADFQSTIKEYDATVKDIPIDYKNRLEKINGIAIVGILNTYMIANGISVSALSSYNHSSNGLHINGLWKYAYTTNGLAVSGLLMKTFNTNGISISIVNQTSNRMNGLQIGGYNNSNQLNGVQVGIFNSTKKIKGIQIGIWNKNNRRSLPFINWGF